MEFFNYFLVSQAVSGNNEHLKAGIFQKGMKLLITDIADTVSKYFSLVMEHLRWNILKYGKSADFRCILLFIDKN